MERNNHEKYLIFHLSRILQPEMSVNMTGNDQNLTACGENLIERRRHLTRKWMNFDRKWIKFNCHRRHITGSNDIEPEMDEIKPEMVGIIPEVDRV